MDDPDHARMLVGEALGDLPGRVAAAVVDDEDLEALRQARQRLERFGHQAAHVRLLVVGGKEVRQLGDARHGGVRDGHPASVSLSGRGLPREAPMVRPLPYPPYGWDGGSSACRGLRAGLERGSEGSRGLWSRWRRGNRPHCARGAGTAAGRSGRWAFRNHRMGKRGCKRPGCRVGQGPRRFVRRSRRLRPALTSRRLRPTPRPTGSPRPKAR